MNAHNWIDVSAQDISLRKDAKNLSWCHLCGALKLTIRASALSDKFYYYVPGSPTWPEKAMTECRSVKKAIENENLE